MGGSGIINSSFCGPFPREPGTGRAFSIKVVDSAALGAWALCLDEETEPGAGASQVGGCHFLRFRGFFFPHYQAVLQFLVDVDWVAYSHLHSDTACPSEDSVRPPRIRAQPHQTVALHPHSQHESRMSLVLLAPGYRSEVPRPSSGSMNLLEGSQSSGKPFTS